MMCQRSGLPPISTMAFGRSCDSSEIRVPMPPASMTAFIDPASPNSIAAHGRRASSYPQVTARAAAGRAACSHDSLTMRTQDAPAVTIPPGEERLLPRREFWQGRPVLLTGHTGFKGAWLALWLRQLG